MYKFSLIQEFLHHNSTCAWQYVFNSYIYYTVFDIADKINSAQFQIIHILKRENKFNMVRTKDGMLLGMDPSVPTAECSSEQR